MARPEFSCLVFIAALRRLTDPRNGAQPLRTCAASKADLDCGRPLKMDDSGTDDIVDRTPQPPPDLPAHESGGEQDEQEGGDADQASDSGSPSSSRPGNAGIRDFLISLQKLMAQSKRRGGGDTEDSDQARYTGSSSQSADEGEQQQPRNHQGRDGKVYQQQLSLID